MNNMKAVVSAESFDASTYPRLLSFPQGIPIDHSEMQLAVYQKGTGKKRKTMISTGHNGVTFNGSDIGESSSKNDFYKYAIGILDENTGVLSIHSADHAYVMRPVISGRKDKVRESSMSYAERKQSLTEEFGSRKKKRALLAAQSNTISAENISGASTVEHVMASSLTAEELDKTTAIIDAAEQALEQNRMQLLPAFNEDATEVDEAYPLSGLFPHPLLLHLGERYDALVATLTATESGTVEESQNVSSNVPVSKRALFDLFSSRFASGKESFALLSVGLHAALPPTLPTEIKKKSDKKAIKDKLSQVLMLEYCLWFYREFSNNPHNQIAKDNLVAALDDAPQPLFKHLVDSYSVFKKFNGKPSYVLTKSLSDKLVLYIIILALRIGDFTLDLSVLAQDLKLPASTLSALAREAGCRVIKNKASASSNDESGSGAAHLIADLPVPLKFPKRLGAGGPKKR